MLIFKCKMCGGALEIENGASIATCEYCGTTQTLPKIDDERKANLYDHANHFRRNNEFDKAMGVYEQILNEDNTDAEAYWSLVLCRYGIEYVEDPSSHKRIPTVNRAQFTSVFDDDNYKSALQYADSYQRNIYEEEAKAINEIQKGILAISQKEEPFDVFVCYKESDSSGRRTPDSVLAQDLYYQLTQEGFKVFFARITLEDKLGSAYEPYIFAALNSAKVMVVLGTKSEFFNAVWVKNEWSRYLALIKQGQKKMLIPAYKDMDPYDLPKEFSHLQAQDMSKLGFMQDLIRGIKKIALADAPKTTIAKETVINGGNANTAPLLKRAFMFLEDGDWNSANKYCEKVLDIDPENASAYLGKLLSELRVRKQEFLKEEKEPFDDSNNYQKVVRFADEKLKTALAGYIKHINNARLDDTYNRAKEKMSAANTESAYKKAIDLFESAINLFESISGWKDADEKIYACQKKIEEIKSKSEAELLEKKRQAEIARSKSEAERLEKKRQAEIARKEAERKQKKKIIITTLIVCAIIAFIIFLKTVIIPNSKYKNEVEKLKVAKVGDYVFFGAYEQDRNLLNGKEDIEWLVLDVIDGKVLLISKYGLDCQQYNTSYSDITWETCTLRKWLNNAFINAAFSADEKAMIPTVTVYSTNPGEATQDQVFLLSITEAKKYFSSDSARECKATDYAVAKGANGKCWWWLRSPGAHQNYAAFVFTDGVVTTSGSNVNRDSLAVRPALWIDLNS